MHILRFLRKLKFQWVAIANAILLLGAQAYLYYLQKQPASDQIETIKTILSSNNSSMLWYLIIGSGLCLYPLPGKESGVYRPVHVVLLDSSLRLGIRYAGDDFDDRRFNREVLRFRVFVNPV